MTKPFSSTGTCPVRRRVWAGIGILSCVALLGAGRGQAAGAVYYVSPAGSDLNDGVAGRPFRQIRRALQVAGPGDTVLVADGDYLGFDVRRGGLAGAPLTIRAAGTAANVLPTSDRVDNRDTIFITYAPYVVIEGFRSANANRAAVRIDASHHVTIRNNTFANNARWGIFTNHSDDLLLESNVCSGSVAEHGIYVSNSGDRPVVRGNRCFNNAACGIQFNADLSAGGDGLITGGLIESNVCYGNGRLGGAAINLDGVQDTIVRNNLLYANQATGIVNYRGDGAAGPRGMQILHNTVDQPATARWALLMQSTTGPNLVRNNVLLHGSTFRGGLLFGGAADVANTNSDYNVVGRVSPDYGSTSLTLGEWQARGYEPHSLTATLASLFVNPVGGDYHLAAGSPAVDRGEILAGVTSDLEGNPRPVGLGSDLGAYEVAAATPPPPPPPPPPAPVALASLTVSRASVRGGSSVKGAVTLSAPAPTGGAVVGLASTHRTVAAVPVSVTVSAGKLTAAFTITTRRPTTPTAVTISGAYGGVTKTATITVKR